MTYPNESLPDLPDEFWELVKLARTDSDRYLETLKGMDREALIHFYWMYENAAGEFKFAPYIEYVSPQLSEDGIDDVAQWVVAQGREYYWDVINHPDKIPERVDNYDPLDVLGAIVDEFDERYDEPIPYPDDQD